MATKNVAEFKNLITVIHNRFDKIYILPIYCEDVELKRIFKIELAYQVEGICKPYPNCTVFHGSVLGEILGDKAKTNKFLTEHGIRCPLIVTNKTDKTVFVNEANSSHAVTKIISAFGEINPKTYNTEYIDTSFDFDGHKYYASIRAMCIKGIITDIFLRFRNVTENNPNVHCDNTPINPELQNFYFNDILTPNMPQLKEICHNMGDLFGFGFYGHDLLLQSETGQIYVAESSFKFDNIIMWKNLIKPMIPFIPHEMSIEKSTKNSLAIFCNTVDSF